MSIEGGERGECRGSGTLRHGQGRLIIGRGERERLCSVRGGGRSGKRYSTQQEEEEKSMGGQTEERTHVCFLRTHQTSARNERATRKTEEGTYSGEIRGCRGVESTNVGSAARFGKKKTGSWLKGECSGSRGSITIGKKKQSTTEKTQWSLTRN